VYIKYSKHLYFEFSTCYLIFQYQSGEVIVISLCYIYYFSLLKEL